jgi:hypothetical protein
VNSKPLTEAVSLSIQRGLGWIDRAQDLEDNPKTSESPWQEKTGRLRQADAVPDLAPANHFDSANGLHNLALIHLVVP